jgi:CRISPR-associated protein Csm4
MKIIYLIPRSGYVTDLRSDTLWGSLCWGIRYLWGTGELTEFLERCNDGNPDFVISSAFPFKQHGTERTPFFPNPLTLAPDLTEAERSQARDAYRLRKDLKKVALLNYHDFKAALHGELTVEELLRRLAEIAEQKKQQGRDYTPTGQTVERTSPKRHDHSMTHNTIDRLRGGTLTVTDSDGNDAGQLFHAEDTWWTDPDNESDEALPNTGLYFLADGHDLSKLEPVLHLLRHWGIGADRTAGKGAFDFEIQDFTEKIKTLEPPANQANALLNLSLFRPTEPELEGLEKAEGCWQYLLEQREGYVGGHRERYRKEARMYFREGSVFARPEGLKTRHMGNIQQQVFPKKDSDGKPLPQPPHTVWDNGFGFMVNLNWKKQ